MKIPVTTEYNTDYYNDPKAIEFLHSLPLDDFECYNSVEHYTVHRHYIEINSIEALKLFMRKCPCEIILEQRLYDQEPLMAIISNRRRIG